MTVIREDPLEDVRRLEDGLIIWLCRGSALASALLPEIDRLFLKVSPVVLGRGLPLFGTVAAGVRFAPTAVRRFANGVLFVEYARAGQAQPRLSRSASAVRGTRRSTRGSGSGGRGASSFSPPDPSRGRPLRCGTPIVMHPALVVRTAAAPTVGAPRAGPRVRRRP